VSPSGRKPLSAGDRFGPYRIISVLGEGGMGRVYRAEGPDGVDVALKLVREELAIDETFRRRFAREARMAANVNHPHVVPLVAVGEEDGVPFITQRYIGGGTLEHRLRRERRLPLQEIVRVCLEVAAGLDALHTAGFIHRDLKPANIIFDERGAAYVADLGLAKDPQASVLTRPGTAVGSMDYIAPEQIKGEELTGRADIYALGCVVFECLAGDPPFADREGMRVLWAHLQDEPPNPTLGRDDAPAELGWAVLRALEKDPAKRPPTATAYARIVQLAAGFPTLATGERG
jgi:serine/threonine protein kinase